jgi:hypothetical protein
VNIFNFHAYKFMHLFFVIAFLMSLAITFFNSEKMRIYKVIYIISSVIILASGIMLTIRIGVQNLGFWPVWIKIKVILWALIAFGIPLLAKFRPNDKRKIFWILMSLVCATVYIAVTKPM